MKMIFKIFAFLFLMISNFAYSQYYLKYLKINTSTKYAPIYKARDSILFQNGYTFAATDATEIYAGLDNNLMYPASPVFLQPNPEQLMSRDNPTGSTPGNVNITPSGAFNYSIPLSLPAGLGNNIPTLAVNYNHQSSQGIFGMGFQLSGLSTISRRYKNYYSDGSLNEVTYNDYEDSYALDGSPLYAKSKPEGKIILGTENESYTKISFEIKQDIFKVESANGSVVYYGDPENKNHARIKNGEFTLIWQMYKSIDMHGNIVLYHYKIIPETQQSVIDKIEYGGNEKIGSSPMNIIIFQYSYGDQKRNRVFSSGVSQINNTLIEQITIESGGAIYRKYYFKYYKPSGSFVPYLYSVFEEAPDKSTKNPTVFTWNDTQNTRRSTNESYHVSLKLEKYYDKDGKRRFQTSDLNGDGKNEVVSTPDKDDYLAGFSGDDYLEIIYFDTDYRRIRTPLPHGYKNMIVADFNGDGKSDILFHKGLFNNGKLSFIRNNNSMPGAKNLLDIEIKIMTYNYNQNILQEIDPVVPSYNLITKNKDVTFDIMPGDFNGDRLFDIAFMNNQVINICIAKLNNGKLNFEVIEKSISDKGQFYIGDYNADGASDLIQIKDLGTFVHYFKKSKTGNGYLDYNNTKVSDIITSTAYLSCGDFNGDGSTDFLHKRNVYLGSGNSNYPAFKSEVEKDYEDRLSYDFNMDGKSDFSRSYLWGDEKSMKLALDINYSDGYMERHNLLSDLDNPNYFQLLWVDFQGDGDPEYFLTYAEETILQCNQNIHTDMNHPCNCNNNINSGLPVPETCYTNRVAIESGGTILDYIDNLFKAREYYYKIGHLNEQNIPKIITKITDGHFNVVNIKYNTLTDKSVCKVSNSDKYSYPILSNSVPIRVVENYSIEYQDIIQSKIEFQYENPFFNLLGKGFIGFEKLCQNNTIAQTISTTKLEFDWRFCTCKKQHNMLSLHDGTILESDFSEFETHDLTTKYPEKFNITIPVYSEKTDINQNTIKESRSYKLENINKHAIPESKTITLSNHENKIHSTTFVSNTTKDVNEFSIISKTNTTIKTADDMVLSSEEFIFDSKRPFLVKEMRNELQFQNQAKVYSSQVFQYDDYGNSKLIRKINKTGSTQINNTYSADGRFLIASENELQHKTQTKYNLFGWKESETDINNLTTNYRYDAFGRLIEQTAPDGNWIKYKYEWGIGNGHQCIRTKASNSPDVNTYIDQLGKEYLRETYDFNGKEIWDRVKYNQKGQLFFKSGLKYAGDPTSLNETNYEYYPDGRIKKTYGRNNKNEVSYEYGPNRASVTSDGKTIITENDAAGNPISVNEPAGEIKYKYNAAGSVIEITAPGNTITKKYDEFGYLKSQSDASAGTTEYTNNAFGELISQSDAENRQVSLLYDKLGRCSEEKYSDGLIINYEYDKQMKGLIHKIASSEGIVKEFAYDDLGRLQQTTESINGKSYLFKYVYDEFGNMKKKTYPHAYEVIYEYNTQGYLTKVMDNKGHLIWQGLKCNANGQWTDYLNGDYQQVSKQYTEDGNLFSVQTSDYRMTNKIIHSEYDFNKENGNLNYRKDYITNNIEKFKYDSKDRLLSWKVNEGNEYTMQYTDINNIEVKSDMGVMSYNNIKNPHQITEIDDHTAPASKEMQNIIYNNINKTEKIIENNSEVLFLYDETGNRKKMEVKTKGILSSVKYYIGGTYEEEYAEGIERRLYYIFGGDGLSAVYVSNSSGSDTLYYIHSDHIGSWVAVSNNRDTKVVRANYDPWGRERDAQTWSYEINTKGIPFSRGFTGHEHLRQFQLINMNGRMYDPLLGMFVSPDNYVQAPQSALNYNRYTYCLNNPLKYTDPSGEIIFTALAAAFCPALVPYAIQVDISWISSVIAYSYGESLNNFENWNLKDFGYAALTGAVNGVISAMNPFSCSAGGFSFGVQPTFMFSRDGMSFGINLGADLNIGKYARIGADVGLQHYFKTTGTEEYNEQVFTFGYGLELGTKKNNLDIYSTFYGATDGSTQRVGGLGIDIGKFNLRYENDGAPMNHWFGKMVNDGEDRYRTAAAQIGYGDVNLRVQLFTGRAASATDLGQKDNMYPNRYYKGGDVDKYRLGALSIGYGDYRVGANSEKIRHVFQNQFAHGVVSPQPAFKVLDNKWNPYYYYGTSNRYSLWY